MADNKKKFSSTVKQLFGNDLNAELRQLIDLAVRKQFNAQDFVERLVNTNAFDKKYPGLVERGGTIADALSGRSGAPVSVNSLTAAIRAYGTAFEDFQRSAQGYGYKLTKDQFAVALKHETSPDEFKARLEAVQTIDSNPALLNAFNEQAKLAGLKASKADAYRAAVKAGDNKFRTIYEASQLQTQLGFSAADSRGLIKDKAISPGMNFGDVNTLIAEVRGNLQGYAPELQAQGINAAKLVKILGNPDAFTAEMDTIRGIAQKRQSLHGRPVAGSYSQKGTGGGLALYGNDSQAAYG